MTFSFSGSCLNRRTGKTDEWSFDLDVLAQGKQKENISARPALVKRIFPAFCDLFRRGARSTAYRSRYNLLYFWQFLDYQEKLSVVLEPTAPVKFNDLTWEELEALWRHFLDWLRGKPEKEMSARTKYYINATVVQIFKKAHALELSAGKTAKEYLDIYIYFKDNKKSSYGDDVLTFDEAKRAFAVLARTWRDVLTRIHKGHELASQGRSPMAGSSGLHRWEGGPWQSLANRLWTINELKPFAISEKAIDEIGKRIRDGMGYPIPAGTFPRVLEFGDTGFWNHVACIFPTMNEMAVAFAMVTMKSGMNPDAVAGMRVDRWYKPDPMYPGKRVIVFGPKRIAGRVQRASSSIHRKTDPYQIISKIVELMSPFRRVVSEWAERTGDPKLRELAQLVWIFPSTAGVSSFLPGSNALNAAHKYLDGLFSSANVTTESGNPLKYRFSQGRDVWGLFVYHKSGFNHILTAQALGHSSLTSLLNYLEKRTLKVADRKRLIELQGKVITDLREAEFSPRRYREKLGSAVRAATGLACTDPIHPAPEADPGNPGGRTCRSQGCWACHNWYATLESLPYLMRIILDLKGMREVFAVAVWETSDYPSMLDIYEHIVSKFHRDHVNKAEAVAYQMRPIVTTTRFTTAARAAT